MAKQPKWTPAEDEILRRGYARKNGSRAKLLKALPGRSWGACMARAERALGVKRKPRWTKEDDRRLRSMWCDTATRALQEAFRPRTWDAIRKRALELGIGDERWQGHKPIARAAADLGVTYGFLVRVLERFNVTRTRRVNGCGTKGKFYLVEWDDVLEAWSQWERLETVADAAARHDIPFDVLSKWVTVERVAPWKKRVRLPPEEFDRIINERRARTTDGEAGGAGPRRVDQDRGAPERVPTRSQEHLGTPTGS